MSQLKLIIIQDIKVQNANAVSGFVHSALSSTQILGFTHALNRKLQQKNISDIDLKGSALIVKDYHAHTFRNDSGGIKFTQSRNPPYLSSVADGKKSSTAPVIEEGKMNITLSLLIAYEGEIDNSHVDKFCQQLEKLCYLNRIGGGSIQDIKQIKLFRLDKANDNTENDIRGLMRSLLPGFVLFDRSDMLLEHKQASQQSTLASWMDFISLKQYAVPKYDLIDKHFEKQQDEELLTIWQQYLQHDYQTVEIPDTIINYFDDLMNDKASARKFKSVISQWQEYYQPTNKTDASWHYQPKPSKGFLVPIMCGYKAISEVYDNIQVKNTRDIVTDVCFTEAVHSIGEWQGIHRIKTFEDLLSTIWCYNYEDNWYLCKQNYQPTVEQSNLNPKRDRFA